MANITFSSPKMRKPITVYAVAGDRGTLLAVAKSHKIPIPFDCGDGDCGSCCVEVTHVTTGKPRMGLAMTEEEKERLRQLGKVTAEEIEAAETSDMPPRFRLACQMFIRDEDILVSFDGDEVLPETAPAVTIAAPIFKGGQEIKSIEQFLAYSVSIEQEAADHFEELSAAMDACGNTAVADLFRKLGEYALLHLGEAKARAGDADLEPLMPGSHVWPDLETPERTALWAGDPDLSKRDALKAALEGEQGGYEFYLHVAETNRSPEIRKMAKEFVKEESEHVAILERWIAGEEAAFA
jgi:rubrerythrin/ferredoxin